MFSRCFQDLGIIRYPRSEPVTFACWLLGNQQTLLVSVLPKDFAIFEAMVNPAHLAILVVRSERTGIFGNDPFH